MASDKKRRKVVKHKEPKPTTGKPFVHPDGDRRRRHELKKVLRDMRAREAFEAKLQSPPDEEE